MLLPGPLPEYLEQKAASDSVNPLPGLTPVRDNMPKQRGQHPYYRQPRKSPNTRIKPGYKRPIPQGKIDDYA